MACAPVCVCVCVCVCVLCVCVLGGGGVLQKQDLQNNTCHKESNYFHDLQTITLEWFDCQASEE